MKASLFALLTLLGVSSACLATYPPTYLGRRVPPRQTHHAREIRLAHIDFSLFDPYVRDIFVFNGQPTTVTQITVGVSATGQSITLPAPGSVPAGGGWRKVVAEDRAADDGAVIDGYEDGARAASAGGRDGLLARALASLQAGGCASCHGGGKGKGGVTLLSPDGSRLVDGIDWNSVASYTESKAGEDPACPQGGKGRRMTPEEVRLFRSLAKE